MTSHAGALLLMGGSLLRGHTVLIQRVQHHLGLTVARRTVVRFECGSRLVQRLVVVEPRLWTFQVVVGRCGLRGEQTVSFTSARGFWEERTQVEISDVEVLNTSGILILALNGGKDKSKWKKIILLKKIKLFLLL